MATTRPPYSLFRVTALRVESVTPHMRRVTVDGSCLPAFRAGLPAQWLKVFVPAGEGQALTGRAYTVRRHDPASRRLDLDFVLHGDDGPLSAWAARVEPGCAFEISTTHPRSGFAVAGPAQRYLLLGDETALPAIGGILEALPAGASAEVLVEVEEPADEQAIETAARVDLHWLHRSGRGSGAEGGLEARARALPCPDAGTIVWIAAESSVVRSLRQHALQAWGLDRSRLHAAGYWKRGQADHRDEEASG